MFQLTWYTCRGGQWSHVTSPSWVVLQAGLERGRLQDAVAPLRVELCLAAASMGRRILQHAVNTGHQICTALRVAGQTHLGTRPQRDLVLLGSPCQADRLEHLAPEEAGVRQSCARFMPKTRKKVLPRLSRDHHPCPTSRLCSWKLLMGFDWGAADRSHTLMLPSPLQETRMFSLSCRRHTKWAAQQRMTGWSRLWMCCPSGESLRRQRPSRAMTLQALPRRPLQDSSPHNVAAAEHIPCCCGPCLLPQKSMPMPHQAAV